MRLVRGRGFGDVFRQIVKPITDRYEQAKKTFNALAFGITDYNKALVRFCLGMVMFL